MHTYGTPTTPPSRSSEIWWSGRWDRQHDGVVSMVESFCRQGFAYLHGERRTEKGGFRNCAAAPRKLDQKNPVRSAHFIAVTRGFINLTCYARWLCTAARDCIDGSDRSSHRDRACVRWQRNLAWPMRPIAIRNNSVTF
jgi:hypothetical protein